MTMSSLTSPGSRHVLQCSQTFTLALVNTNEMCLVVERHFNWQLTMCALTRWSARRPLAWIE